jgi:hypothetical protein
MKNEKPITDNRPIGVFPLVGSRLSVVGFALAGWVRGSIIAARTIGMVVR